MPITKKKGLPKDLKALLFLIAFVALFCVFQKQPLNFLDPPQRGVPAALSEKRGQ